MRRFYLLIIISLLFVGCGGGSTEEESEPLPTRAGELGEGESADSPRGETTPEPGLPPTWTPAPDEPAGHIYDVRGSGAGNEGVPITVYVVKAGDTLAEIAAQYGVTVSDLARINDIENIDVIEVGDELIIPVSDD